MKKYLLGTCAVVLALSFSAFTKAPKAKFDTFFYQYTGPANNVDARKDAANYANPQSSAFTCNFTGNECAVELQNVSSTPPAHPDFTNITFDGTTGFPNGGTDFVANFQKN